MYKQMINKLTGELSNQIIRTADGAFIPFCPDNTDYQRFKVDLADGAELLDAEGNVMDGKEFLKTLP